MRTGFHSASRISTHVIPLLLACIFGFLAVRTAWHTEPAFTDASRHAMNGALIYDIVREGGWHDPVNYTKKYYAKLPATSLPYHPPVFPVWEAAVYSIMGVTYVAARMAVGLAVALCCVLLYRIVMTTHGSPLLAVAVVITSAMLPFSQWLAQEVMLEFPSFVFVLIALTCAYHLNQGGPRAAAWATGFALSASIAIWTRQYAAMLVAIPPGLAVLSGSWKKIRDPRMWAAIAFVLLSFGGVIAYSKAANTFKSEEWGAQTYAQPEALAEMLIRHFGRIDNVFVGTLGPVAAGLLAISLLVWIVQRIRRQPIPQYLDFYVLWVIAVLALMMILPYMESRYLFYALPPSLVIVASVTQYAVARKLSMRSATALGTLVIVTAVAVHASVTVDWVGGPRPGMAPWVRGPREAARFVLDSKPNRVLYCGTHNGTFIFAVRSLDQEHRTTVIRGDKIRPENNWPRYIQDLGINYLVVETNPRRRERLGVCNVMATNMPSPFILERELQIESSPDYESNRLRIYRVPDPSPVPINELLLPSSIIGSGMEVQLDPVKESP